MNIFDLRVSLSSISLARCTSKGSNWHAMDLVHFKWYSESHSVEILSYKLYFSVPFFKSGLNGLQYHLKIYQTFPFIDRLQSWCKTHVRIYLNREHLILIAKINISSFLFSNKFSKTSVKK